MNSFMRVFAPMLVTVLAFLGPGLAQEGREATARDIRRLQDELTNLDEQLSALEREDAQADQFRARSRELGENVIYLKVKLERHQRSGDPGTGVTFAEVDDLRQKTAELRDDIDRAFGQKHGDFRLPAGTEFPVRLDEALSSKTARPEDRFEASVYRPVRFEGALVLPAGAQLRGIVRAVEPARHPSKSGRLDLDIDTLYLRRERLDVRATVVDIGDRPEQGVGTAGKAGIGGVLGGILGAVIGGGKGALVGVISGGAGAVLGTKGEEATLPAGTILTVRLQRPLEIPRTEERGEP
jgi:hypothetical protein